MGWPTWREAVWQACGVGVTRERVVLTALCTAAFIAVVDLSVVAVALPRIQRELGFSPAGVQWVMTGYTLAHSGLLLVAGRLADRVGRRRVLVGGLVAFGVCSVVAAASVSAPMLVAARTAQGAGGAAMVPSALSLVTANFGDPDERGRALGAFSAMSALGFVVGVLVGGLVTQYAGWRAVMLLTVPVAAVLLPTVLAAVPESRLSRPTGPLDLPGAASLSAGLGALIFGTVRMGPDGTSAPTVWGPLGMGALLLVAFVAIEHRSDAPVLPLHLFRRRTLAAANAANALKSAVGMAQLYVLTLFLQQVLGASPLQTGLAFTPMALAGLAAALAAGRHHARRGVRATASWGCVLLLAGLVLVVVQLRPGATLAGVVAALVVVEAGFMAAEVPLTVAASTALPDRRGLAAGILNTTTELGNALGLGLAGAVVGWRSAALSDLPAPAALAGALRWGLGAAIAAALLAGLSVRMLRAPPFGGAIRPARVNRCGHGASGLHEGPFGAGRRRAAARRAAPVHRPDSGSRPVTGRRARMAACRHASPWSDSFWVARQVPGNETGGADVPGGGRPRLRDTGQPGVTWVPASPATTAARSSRPPMAPRPPVRST